MSTEKTHVLDTVCKKSSYEEDPISPSSPVFEDLIKIRNYFTPLPDKVADKYFATNSSKDWTFKDGGGSPGGSVAFQDITGEPTDNTKLATELAVCSDSDIDEIFS